ncbi:MAG TPA: imidazoleglycerol-phosphate dehydratase [bacterium]|nr:imidazoleglycerol-phosphate dehydratase [bacterium]
MNTDNREVSRTGTYAWRTGETGGRVSVNLDGTGCFEGGTGLGFFDHMLDSLFRFSEFDGNLKVEGDPGSRHHTIEDTGTALGTALNEALNDRLGINRFGWCLCPMDESLVRVSLDLSGRSGFYLFTDERVISRGETMLEFFRSISRAARWTLHLGVLHAENRHHALEASFKGLGLVLRQASALGRGSRIPSVKGIL